MSELYYQPLTIFVLDSNELLEFLNIESEMASFVTNLIPLYTVRCEVEFSFRIDINPICSEYLSRYIYCITTALTTQKQSHESRILRT